MLSFLSQSPVQVIVSVLALMVVSSIAYFVVARIRDSSRGEPLGGGELAKNFEEMRLEGDISDQEFRNIQSVLGKSRIRDTNESQTATLQ